MPQSFRPKSFGLLTLAITFVCVAPGCTQHQPSGEDAQKGKQAEVACNMSDWSPGKAYKTGDAVRYERRGYRCLQPHSSMRDWNPVATPALWQATGACADSSGGTGASAPPQDDCNEPTWAAGTNYTTGNRVSHVGRIYVCRQPHNALESWAPNLAPALWSEEGSCSNSGTLPADPIDAGVSNPADSSISPEGGSSNETPRDDGGTAGGETPSDNGSTSNRCGYKNQGTPLHVANGIDICMPPVVCAPETCPPSLGDCVNGKCVYKGNYKGIQTLPEAWATHYCDLSGAGCHGVTQVNFPEVTAQMISSRLGAPLCVGAKSGTGRCVGVTASSPMVVGNSQITTDPKTGTYVYGWGLGMTEASGLCYEIEGPGGKAIVAVVDRCGGYCKCNGSGYQECGACVNAKSMEPQCACVGPVPGLHSACCGRGCEPETKNDCDWCASTNHPHFDLDIDTFKWVCGPETAQGSCKLGKARFVKCLEPNPAWPPGR